MKTFGTIFIAGTIIGSIMTMGNKEEFDIIGFGQEPTYEFEETLDFEEDLFDPVHEFDFNKLFLLEKEMELALDEIEYMEWEEEIQPEVTKTIIDPKPEINYDKVFHIEEEIVLNLDEINYMELEDEEVIF